MKNSIWTNRNSRSRTALDKELITIRFKTVYPDFVTWVQGLTKFGVTADKLQESIYNMLSGMIGNAYMKFTTGEKINAYTAFKYNEFWAVKERNDKLYNLEMKDLLTNDSTNTQSLFTIGRKADTGLIDADYIDNKVVSTIMSKMPIADRMNIVKQFNNMKNPELVFMIKLANAIVLPIQPNQEGDLY